MTRGRISGMPEDMYCPVGQSRAQTHLHLAKTYLSGYKYQLRVRDNIPKQTSVSERFIQYEPESPQPDVVSAQSSEQSCATATTAILATMTKLLIS